MIVISDLVMASSKSLRVRKEIDYKLLNEGEILSKDVYSKIRPSDVSVLPDSYSVERIIRQKTTDEVSTNLSYYWSLLM